MDLRLYARVLSRFWHVLLAGLVVAIIFSVFSYVRVSFSFDSGITVTHRSPVVWESMATLGLTEPRSVKGQSIITGPDLQFASLSPIYARLASGPNVRKSIEKKAGRLPGRFFAVGVVESIPLPLITTIGQASSPDAALRTVRRGSSGFIKFVESQQRASKIPTSERVELVVVSTATAPRLLAPRKKTLPIFLFLAVLSATIALAFVLENAFPRAVLEQAEDALEIRLPAAATRLEAPRDVARSEAAAQAPATAMSARLESTNDQPAQKPSGAAVAETPGQLEQVPDVEEVRTVRRWA